MNAYNKVIKNHDDSGYANKYIVVISIILCFISLEPWYIWHFNKSLISLLLVCMFLLVASLKYKSFDLKRLFVLFPFVYFLVVVYDGLSDIARIYTVTFLYLFYFVCLNKFEYVAIYSGVERLLAIVLGIGIPFYLLNMIYPLPYFEYVSRNIDVSVYYKNYLFFLVPGGKTSYFDLIVYRYCGVFDEPGVVGTVALLILAGNGMRLNNVYQIILFVSGLLSFSLFFYIGLVVLFIIINFKSVFDKKYLTVMLLIISLFYVNKESEFVEKYIVSRMQFTDGKLVGDNRIRDNWAIFYENYKNNENYFIGHGVRDGGDIFSVDMGASYQMYVYMFGYIGVAFILLMYLYIIWTIGERNIFLTAYFMLVLLLSFYQRPWILSFYYPIIVFSSAANMLKSAETSTIRKII